MKYLLTTLFLIFVWLPASAANYTCAGEAFVCGVMQVILFSAIAFIVRVIKNLKSDNTEQ